MGGLASGAAGIVLALQRGKNTAVKGFEIYPGGVSEALKVSPKPSRVSGEVSRCWKLLPWLSGGLVLAVPLQPLVPSP